MGFESPAVPGAGAGRAQALRWEYCTVVKRMGTAGWGQLDRDADGGISLRPMGQGDAVTELSRLLNGLGADGWELVSLVADELVFKRPLLKD